MGNVWTIAAHTLREALRMKAVLAFGLLILAVVLFMPLAVYREDAMVSAMVQTFLAWALMPISVILSLLAVFLGCQSISDEMNNKQIFLLVCKPVSRWTYVMGKWVGVVTVLTVLLAFSGLCVYGVARLMASRPNADSMDPYTLRHQVLTARASSQVKIPDVAARAERIFQRRVEAGSYVDPTRIKEQNEKSEIIKELMAFERTVPPGEYRIYEFKDILLPAESREVVDVRLFDVPRSQRDTVIGVLVESGHHPAEAERILEDLPQTVAERLPTEDAGALVGQLVRAGGKAALQSGFLLQLRYKAQGLGYLTDETLVTSWHFGPTPELAAQERPVHRKDRKERFHTIHFAANAVGDDGRVFVIVRNMEHQRQDKAPQHPGAAVQFSSGSLEVLYVIGTFGGNLARTLFLVWCRLALVAGVAVCAATFLSYPVACLVAFVFYVLAVSADYVESAMDFGKSGEGIMGTAQYVIQPVMEVVYWAFPKFAEYDGVEVFVDGRNVSLMWDLQAFGKLGLLTMVFVLIACVVFQRRQVAELSI